MGPDDIPALLLKNTVTASAHLLSTLFIRFFGEGWIPPSWRKAIIIPIFKNSGPASDVTNYRPIALTNIIAKIYEKCILRGLLQYLTSHDLIPSGQFGGLPGRSTTLQLIHCYDQWSRMSEAGNHYDTFFLDITKAFDRVPRSRLASCLCDLGIPHILVRAIMLLFDDRSHRVRVGSTLSATSSTSSGVIQGTVLGCILFVLYTAPLSTIIYPIVLYTFIDDIKWSVNTSQDSNAQDHLNKITSWLEKHGLEASAPKSCVLHCGRHNPKSIYTTYGNDITTCDIHKDLGIFFSRDLGFNHHIESIVSKANRISFGVLSRYRGCDRSSLTLAFTTFIRPILEYAAPLWSPSQVLQIDHIERVQRSFTRRLFPGDTPSYGDRCSRLSIHSLEWRRIYLDLCLFYKIIEKPVYGSPLVDPISFCPPNSTRGHNRKIKIPFTRSTVRKNSFFLRAAEIWNNLPQDIVNAETMGTFKAKLKNHDLSTYCHRFKF